MRRPRRTTPPPRTPYRPRTGVSPTDLIGTLIVRVPSRVWHSPPESARRQNSEARLPRWGAGPRRARRRSAGADLVGLRALLALDDLEGDPLALVEALVAVHLDGGVVDEDVLAAVHGDEAEALLGVEPLHGALCHVRSHVSCCGRPPGS